MNIADPFKQLVERKLWPIALLMVAALVAVPFLLAKEPEPTVLPTAVATQPGGPDATAESIVTLDDPTRVDDARAVLGARKDPFRPAQLHPVPTVEDSLGESATSARTTSSASSSSSSGAGATTNDAGGTPSTPAPPVASKPDPVAPSGPAVSPTVEPVNTFATYSPEVRFGLEGDLATRELKRLSGLPGGPTPAALYLGISENLESAVFLVDGDTRVDGGVCAPSPDNCQTVVLEPGETAMLTRGEKQWRLDLIDIEVAQTTDAREARAARTAVAKGGRGALRHFNGTGGYRYSKASGTVRRIERRVRGLSSAGSGGGSKLLSTG